jgi:hypothetical protein
MDDGRNDAMQWILDRFSPLLRWCLSLAMIENTKLKDNHLSAICTKNRAIYDIILHNLVCEQLIS